MAEEISCPYCGHPNPAEALFCRACSRVLEDPHNLGDQDRKIYLDLEQALVTEDTAFLYGETYPISEIKEVEVNEISKKGKKWGVGLILFGLGTIIDGLFDENFVLNLACGFPILALGALLVVISKPPQEKLVATLWITTADGEEHSQTIDDRAEAQAIKEAIQRSCADQGVELVEDVADAP